MLRSLVRLKWHSFLVAVLMIVIMTTPVYAADRDEFRRSIFEDGADNEVLIQFGNTGTANMMELFDGTVSGGTLIFRIRQNGTSAAIEAVNGLFLNYSTGGGVGSEDAIMVMTERGADPAFGVTNAAAWYVKDVGGEERPFFETSIGTVYDMLLGGAGGSDVTSLNINYTVPSDPFSVFAALNIQLDVGSGPLAASSEVHGICIAAAGSTSGVITGLGTHGSVSPIHQHIGVFQLVDQTTPDAYAGLFPSGGSFDDGADGKTVVPDDNDEIYIGAVEVFSELEVILSTPASAHISQSSDIVIEYQHTDTTWDAFIPIDGTDGFQQNGLIIWNSEDLTDWKSDSDPGGADGAAGRWVRIRRTRNNIITDPIVTTIKTLEPDEFGWDETGKVTGDAVVTNSLHLGAERWDDGSDKIDGEQLGDDTVDTDALDYISITLGSFTDDINNTVDTDWDNFAKLQAAVSDKTLVNEEDAATWDALGTFALGVTITTGDPFTLGANRIDDGSDLLNGEQIADNTIDEDSPDWGAGAGQIDADDVPESATLRFAHIDTSFPGAPVEGDLFYHSTYNIQFQYDGSLWVPNRSYSALTIYVNETSGSDAAGKGYTSGAGATATIQYAIDNAVPVVIGGNVTILVTAETYSEELVLPAIAITGAYTVTIQGTLASQDTGTADADSTVTEIEDNGQGWTPSEHAGRLIIMTSGPASGEERFIRDNDADTLNIAGRFTTDPDTAGTSTFTIYTLGTIISPGAGNTGALLTSASHWGFKYLEFSGGSRGIHANAGSKNIVVTSCEFDTQTPIDGIQVSAQSHVTVNTGYIHASAQAGVRITGSYARLDDVYILGCNTGDVSGFAGAKVLNGGTGVFFRCYIDGNNRYGILNQYNSNIQFGAGGNVSSIVNHDTVGDVGIKTERGAQAQNATTMTFNNNDDDTDADASTGGYET